MSKTIFIGGRLESKEKGNVVTGANAILDDTKGKMQNVINKETDDELLRLEQSKQDNLTFDNAPTEDSTNPVTSGGVYTAEKALSDAIEAILLLIPSAATALNKLVDTNTMNSSISTATATFRGTYNVVSDLGLTYQATHAQIEAALDALGLTADNNDYAFVQVPVSDQSQDIAKTERYKNNGTNWQYEYDLNTSGFTAAQWGAINSTITLALVQKLAALPTNAELLQALGLKQDVLTFDNAPTTDSNNPVKSGGIKNAIDTAVGDEATARDNADTALASLIDDEKTRAEGVEGGLNTRLGAVEGSVTTIQDVTPSGATSSNKLVDNNSMTTYISTIIDNIDATFNITSTDGHVTLAITQVNGVITSVQLTTSDIASAAALNLKASQADLTALAGRVTTAESILNTTKADKATTIAGYGIMDAYTKTEVNDLVDTPHQNYVTVSTYASLPASGSTDTIYRVSNYNGSTSQVDASVYTEYAWNGSAYVFLSVKSQVGEVFDISEYNASAKYADLAAALGTDGANVPESVRKGGMSIKFVQSSDNKYVQYFCNSQTFTTVVTEWEKINNAEEFEKLDNLDSFVNDGIGTKDETVYPTNLLNLNASDFVPNHIIYPEDGQVSQNVSTQYSSTGFIACEPGENYSYNDGTQYRYARYVLFYDRQKNYLGSSYTLENINSYWTTPSGAYYMRFTLYISTLEQYTTQITKGSAIVPYSEWFEPTTNIKYYFKNPFAEERNVVNILNSDSEQEIFNKLLLAYNTGNTDVYFEFGTYTFSDIYIYMRDTLGWSWTMELPIGNNNRYFFNGSTIISNAPSVSYDDSRNIFGCKAGHPSFRENTNFELHDGILINNGGTYCVHDE